MAGSEGVHKEGAPIASYNMLVGWSSQGPVITSFNRSYFSQGSLSSISRVSTSIPKKVIDVDGWHTFSFATGTPNCSHKADERACAHSSNAGSPTKQVVIKVVDRVPNAATINQHP